MFMWNQNTFNFVCVCVYRQSSVKQSVPTGCLAEKLVVWLTSEGISDLHSLLHIMCDYENLD